MLDIKKITKIYKTEGYSQKALDGVSVSFRKSEFASILGPSGSGKTTLLNIIGGLDKYTFGDLIINGISTKKYSDRDWDSYRNHRVGFVFQNYNLISHQSILRNVELALTLSGCSKVERRKRALKALDEVGLSRHVNKKPNQLSGGQMQRVAIARALVNDPEIILADEPTGALDSDTSIQIMKILKNISKSKLVIMVTHNPDLAKEYSSRIINIKDGKIINDSNPFISKKSKIDTKKSNNKRTKMSFFTALSLSFNNLMTKKGRTILVSIAGSIGIIGIALILAVSTGFQKYVDMIGEDTLTSYPLTIMQESSDIAGALLSMREGNDNKDNSKKVIERQYITSMLSNISTNDLKSFKKYIEDNHKIIDDDLSNISYSYSVDPYIYTIDASKKIAKVNPSNLFSSMMGGSNIMQSYSSMASIFTKIVDNREEIEDDYKVLAGRWPKEYNEMIIVLSEENSISDLLVYSLGFRDTEELNSMVTKIMSGEEININNKPLNFSYDDLLNVDLRLIMPSDLYRYNTKYDVYEDMSEDKDYMNNLYNEAIHLKIVGVVTAKEGKTSMALNPGIGYTSKLTNYIIDYASESDIVKRQLENKDVDIFSGKKFDEEKNNFDFEFADLVKVDNEKLKKAFNLNIDTKDIENETKNYMNDISNSIDIDTSKASLLFKDNFNIFSKEIFDSIDGEFKLNDIDSIVSKYLDSNKALEKMSVMERDYVIPRDSFKTTYKALINGLLQAYVNGYVTYNKTINPQFTYDEDNPSVIIIDDISNTVMDSYVKNGVVMETVNKMGKVMTEAKVKRDVLSKVGELTANLTSKFATAFNVNQDMITSAFQLNFSENELARVVNAMMNPNETTQKSNLIKLGYQDREEPTYISFYFKDFEAKEHFMSFLDKYNKNVVKDKKINYSDTAGILISSVKTIVDAVSYVLIAFVSISLIVSSIMIGVITYISVYERTKEIGVLRAIGASKGNISSIFNAETFIIGFLSGMFGITISYCLIPIINMILHHFIGNVPLAATLFVNHAVILVILSIILTLIGGLIPARAASLKDPVVALRSE